MATDAIAGRTVPGRAADWLRRRYDELVARDRLVVGTLVALAALIRLPGLETRGVFDADQGRDLGVIWRFVHDGVVPLLGPETISIANSHLHHGALYWYLFAPASWLSGGDPYWVTVEVALFGVAAVAATWWAGRAIGGRTVGLAAGVLMLVSPAAIEQSLFLWNPNPVPLFAALAVGGTWLGHRTAQARWYVLGLASGGAAVQLHVLGALLMVCLLALIAGDIVVAYRADRARLRRVVSGLVGGVVALVVLFTPLLIEELQTGFSEFGRIVNFFVSGPGQPSGGLDKLASLAFTFLRVVGWPFVGQIVDAPAAAALVMAVAIGLIGWRVVGPPGEHEERLAARWLAGSILVGTVGLAFVAPWLRFVVPGFPVDHYHAFLNPPLLILLPLAGKGLIDGAARRFGADPATSRRGPAGIVSAAMLVLMAVGIVVAIIRWPAPTQVASWSVAKAVATQVVADAQGRSIAVVGLPDFKSPDSIGYPILILGGHVVDDVRSAEVLVVSCDQRFLEFNPGPCGGIAEDRYAATLLEPDGLDAKLVERLPESAALIVSVYDVAPATAP